MATLPDGTYKIAVPMYYGKCICSPPRDGDTGRREDEVLLLTGDQVPDPSLLEVEIKYNSSKGGNSFMFKDTELYVSYNPEDIRPNAVLVVSDKARYYKIDKHDAQYSITLAEKEDLTLDAAQGFSSGTRRVTCHDGLSCSD